MFELQQELFAFIQSNATTYQFFSPYFGTVLVKSSEDILVLNASYGSFFGTKTFFLAEIDADRTAGRQLREIWDWINNPVPPEIPYEPLGPLK